MDVTLSYGRRLTFPVCFDGVDQVILSFDVRASDIARLLPRDLTPLNCGYGLGEMFVHWQSTRVSDMGSFAEVLVGFLVVEPYYRQQGVYFLVNPVTSAEARTLGMDLWGLHKVLADIQSQRANGRQRCTLTMDGQFVLALDVPLVEGRPEELTTLACAGQGGRATVFRYRQFCPRSTMLERPQDARLELGSHALSAKIAGLRVGTSVKRYILREDNRILIGPSLAQVLAAGDG
ncbi:MAG: acetoacetate decarboxylase family protein [Gammaproteobacteria bacterium]